MKIAPNIPAKIPSAHSYPWLETIGVRPYVTLKEIRFLLPTTTAIAGLGFFGHVSTAKDVETIRTTAKTT